MSANMVWSLKIRENKDKQKRHDEKLQGVFPHFNFFYFTVPPKMIFFFCSICGTKKHTYSSSKGPISTIADKENAPMDAQNIHRVQQNVLIERLVLQARS